MVLTKWARMVKHFKPKSVYPQKIGLILKKEMTGKKAFIFITYALLQ